jgi:hypothetical protein
LVLAIIVLRHVVYEIIAAFLGSLPLLRQPQSKPIIPMFFCQTAEASSNGEHLADTSSTRDRRPRAAASIGRDLYRT